jgi:hypothetical protein
LAPLPPPPPLLLLLRLLRLWFCVKERVYGGGLGGGGGWRQINIGTQRQIMTPDVGILDDDTSWVDRRKQTH